VFHCPIFRLDHCCTARALLGVPAQIARLAIVGQLLQVVAWPA
jgi:hypothetical protein